MTNISPVESQGIASYFRIVLTDSEAKSRLAKAVAEEAAKSSLVDSEEPIQSQIYTATAFFEQLDLSRNDIAKMISRRTTFSPNGYYTAGKLRKFEPKLGFAAEAYEAVLMIKQELEMHKWANMEVAEPGVMPSLGGLSLFDLEKATEGRDRKQDVAHMDKFMRTKALGRNEFHVMPGDLPVILTRPDYGEQPGFILSPETVDAWMKMYKIPESKRSHYDLQAQLFAERLEECKSDYAMAMEARKQHKIETGCSPGNF